MATAPVKSQPLHYFSLPQLKWSTNKTHTNTNHHRFRRRDSPPSNTNVDGDGGGGGGSDSDKLQHQEEEEQVEETGPLWNLRPRRSEKVSSLKKDESSSSHAVVMLQRSQRLKENAADGNGLGSGSAKKGKRKLWISLSKEEIEEDVYSMTGSRPARRPKKRSKAVQKQLDNAFPGLYLVGLTADSFRVNDATILQGLWKSLGLLHSCLNSTVGGAGVIVSSQTVCSSMNVN
ncbi:putative E3 ubiquitin-protein ligase HOS1-like [Capsicum annuum]|nr:putative E3 ubiquitin-protein ligase HOS1-like [Capsicum annuum]